MLTLYIGNKNYSSWSMRPWVLLKQAGIPFEERMIRFDTFEADSNFKREVLQVNPAGPRAGAGGRRLRRLGHAGDRGVRWPRNSPTGSSGRGMRRPAPGRAASAPRCTRASARCASHCPMNIEASLPQVGAGVWRDQAGRAGRRGSASWRCGPSCWQAAPGPHAVRRVQHRRRLLRAGVHAPAHVRAAGAGRRHGLRPPRLRPAGGAGLDEDALAEQDFVAVDEPYRTALTPVNARAASRAKPWGWFRDVRLGSARGLARRLKLPPCEPSGSAVPCGTPCWG